MFFTGLSGYLKPATRIRGWRDNKARSLTEAARLAHALAAADGLAIGKTMVRAGGHGDGDGWYAQSILDTVPVYGTRDSAPERIETKARLGLERTDDKLCAGVAPVWRNLRVKCADFGRYVDWLRSVW
ncbi:MAG: hypothetical protein KGM97_00445 [Alphaproteobacteria bacterium]|nr:hypothetical protein [Alphaproteobacteria bacterium]MDE2629431.1 hypothetical protein [Alphaproteobacteria bacterium]